MRKAARGVALIVALAGLPACGQPEAGVDSPGPAIIAVDSIVVIEPDSLPLASPMGLGVDASFIYITDAFYQRIIQYDRNGNVRRVFGRKGRGPGEFAMVGYPAPIQNLIVAFDDSRRVAVAFDTTNGDLRWELPYEGGANAVSVTGDAVWFSLTNAAKNTVAGRLDVAEPRIEPVAGLPEAMRRSAAFAAVHAMNQILVSGDTLFLGYSGLDSLVAVTRDGSWRESTWIPARRRRTPPPEGVVAFYNKPRPIEELFQAASFWFGLQRMRDGSFALLHFDQDRDGRRILSRPFVSVVSPDRRRACLDAAVPLTSESRMVPTFRGDTLMILAQSVDSTGVRSTIHSYLIDTRRCRWDPITPAGRSQ